VAAHFDAREQRFGGYLDQYAVGDTFRHWPGKTITEAEDHLFCMLTMAVSPIHVDREYARTEMEQGRNMVVGTLIYALLLGMSVPDISGRAIASLGVRSLEHLEPVFHGDTLYGSSEVLEVRVSATKPDRGVLTVRTAGANQDGVRVCVFERSVLLPREPSQVTANG
jgi:acyl dehydratase